ncbi:MAG: hypothetical protein ACRDZ4_23780 [Egibacteraceae bacterium]
MFTAPAGGPLRRSNYRHKVWLPSIARAGLDGLRFHDLRHTAVALWVAAGANVLEVKQRAGHTRSTFTLDRYGHLFPNADKGLASRLDDLYGRNGPDASVDVRGAVVVTPRVLVGKPRPLQDTNPLLNAVDPAGIEPATSALQMRVDRSR